MIRSRDVIRKGNEHDQTNPVDSPKRLLIKITFKIIELLVFSDLAFKKAKKSATVIQKKESATVNVRCIKSNSFEMNSLDVSGVMANEYAMHIMHKYLQVSEK